jgi:energy-coupling factor transporter ATP-binding protein EcfA2
VGIVQARVRDFQSIKDVSVDFGDFTVLVGPSSSGKSAFLRAVRACVRNSFFPAMVRTGAVKSVVNLTFDDIEVGIERGKSLSTYLLGKGDQTFTKSARSVPPEIEKALSMPLIEGTDASLVFQFDRPFLLAEPGARVAQVIGSLTNASLLHAAVREVNRRSLDASHTLKVRTADLERHKEQAKQFLGLKQRGQDVEEAEELVRQARSLTQQRDILRAAVERLNTSKKSLESLTAVQPPDPTEALNAAEQVVSRLKVLKTALATMLREHSALQAQFKEATRLRVESSQAEEEHSQYLKSLGVCPTCGAATH